MNEVFRVLSEEAESPAFRHFGEWMLDYYFKSVEQAQELNPVPKEYKSRWA